MSAYIEDKAHVDAIVRVAVEGPAGIPVNPGTRWGGVWDDETGSRLTIDDADRIGLALWLENLRSVAARYPNDASGHRPGPIGLTDDDVHGYTYDDRNARSLTVPEAFAAIHGLEYQSCEHEGWRGSWARSFLLELTDQLTRYVDGYDDAGTWSISPRVTS